jgi:hypothetical protein
MQFVDFYYSPSNHCSNRHESLEGHVDAIFIKFTSVNNSRMEANGHLEWPEEITHLL